MCSETYLYVGLLIAQVTNGFSLVDQIIKIKLNGIKYLIIGDTSNHNIIICCIISGSAFQNEIELFFGIAVKFQDFKFLVNCFVKSVAGNKSVFTTTLKFLAPFYCLLIKRGSVNSFSQIYLQPLKETDPSGLVLFHTLCGPQNLTVSVLIDCNCNQE